LQNRGREGERKKKKIENFVFLDVYFRADNKQFYSLWWNQITSPHLRYGHSKGKYGEYYRILKVDPWSKEAFISLFFDVY
jgi:hypothetical protein